MKIGAQFYTLRDFCKTTEDLVNALMLYGDAAKAKFGS